MTAEPLTPEEEATFRDLVAHPVDDGKTSLYQVRRLLATLDAARTADPGGLREALDTLGPVTFGPGCAPFDHPLTCQCPYPVAAAERDRLRAATPEATAPEPDR